MYKLLILPLLAVAIYAAETAHFYAINVAGAPDSFVQSVLNYLEEAYYSGATTTSSFPPPLCQYEK